MGWMTPDVPNGGRGIPKDAIYKKGSIYTQEGRKVQFDLNNQVKAWATPQAHDSKAGKADRVGRFGTAHGGRNLADEALLPNASQYPYEPPRVITGQKNRAKRLKCLGNSVVPQQADPIFEAIMLAEVLS